jgi:hypothetical protein
MVDETSRRLCHAPCTTVRAEAAALEGEGDHVLVAAALARHADEAVFEAPRREIVRELALDEARGRYVARS